MFVIMFVPLTFGRSGARSFGHSRSWDTSGLAVPSTITVISRSSSFSLPFLAPRSSSLHPIPALLQGTHRARSDTTARTRAMETSMCLECRRLGTSTTRSMVVTSITGAVVCSWVFSSRFLLRPSVSLLLFRVLPRSCFVSARISGSPATCYYGCSSSIHLPHETAH